MTFRDILINILLFLAIIALSLVIIELISDFF